MFSCPSPENLPRELIAPILRQRHSEMLMIQNFLDVTVIFWLNPACDRRFWISVREYTWKMSSSNFLFCNCSRSSTPTTSFPVGLRMSAIFLGHAWLSPEIERVDTTHGIILPGFQRNFIKISLNDSHLPCSNMDRIPLFCK